MVTETEPRQRAPKLSDHSGSASAAKAKRSEHVWQATKGRSHVTAASDSSNSFFEREYETLNTEMLESVKETRVLERFALAVIAAVWSWLAANQVDSLIWWAPAFLVAFLYLRARALQVHIDAIGMYLAVTESSLTKGRRGFEAWFADSSDWAFKRRTSLFFWWGLLIVASAAPFALAKNLDRYTLVLGAVVSLIAAGVMIGSYIAAKRAEERMKTPQDRNDEEVLRAVNIEIGEAEARGDVTYFRDLLAPAFAMRRADGTHTADRAEFISAVAKSGDRSTEIDSVTLFPLNRALVTCIVSMKTAEGPKRFHNARLFAREGPRSPWKLLAWANESLPQH